MLDLDPFAHEELPKQHVSPSQIGQFVKCERQWFLKEFVYGPKPPKARMFRSSRFHETAETNYTGKVESGEDMPVADWQEFYAARFDEAREEEDVDWEGEKPGEVKDLGIAMTTLHASERAPLIRPVLVEERFETELPNGIVVVMYPDLFTAERRVIDLKQFGKSKSVTDMQQDMQSSFYLWGLNRHGLDPVDFAWEAVVATKVPKVMLTKEGDVLTKTANANDLDIFEGRANTIVDSMLMKAQLYNTEGRNLFVPNTTGWWCSDKWCGYWDECAKHGRG